MSENKTGNVYEQIISVLSVMEAGLMVIGMTAGVLGGMVMEPGEALPFFATCIGFPIILGGLGIVGTAVAWNRQENSANAKKNS